MARQQRTNIREVIAIDGEGITTNGDHIYTLLLAHSTKMANNPAVNGSAWVVEDWQHGLSTEQILWFLTRSIKHGYDTICASFFFNYDVTHWLRDLPEKTISALWSASWATWRAPATGILYYIKYIPDKIFFVGECTRDMVRDYKKTGKFPSSYNWPRFQPAILIYDVASFSQKSFVSTLKDWDIYCPPEIEEMKKQRSFFTARNRKKIKRYCHAEMRALAEYVQTLDRVFQGEGVRLNGWYGPGAVAKFYMDKYKVKDGLYDPHDENTDLQHAIMCSYFGGRSELFYMGHIPNMHDYDINSAYPAACPAIPDLAAGIWQERDTYQDDAVYGIWEVEWDTSKSARKSIGPFPFRIGREVCFPTAGKGWYHHVEVQAAIKYYGIHTIHIRRGYIYLPEGRKSPFAFVDTLASNRVKYKRENDPRANPYKYGCNSIYGKLAQHANEEEVIPKYQCYAAAGYITAYTRARLLDMAFQNDRTGVDVVMFATDGIFTLENRETIESEELGEYTAKGSIKDIYLVQPGVWYSSTKGVCRTRGFGIKSLSYKRLWARWKQFGINGYIPYIETRFVGIGPCVVRDDFTNYGQWVTSRRILSLAPNKKFPGILHADNCGGMLSLVPEHCAGMVSAPFQPQRPNDISSAEDLLDEELSRLEYMCQPDSDDN